MFRIELPPPSLCDVVEMFWSYEGYAPLHTWDRVLATSSVDLVFPLMGQPLRWRDANGVEATVNGAIVCGPRTSFYDVPVDTQRRMAGIRLKPGGAWSLLGVSVDELSERFVPLESFAGHAARVLDERLQSVGADQRRQLALMREFASWLCERSRVQRHDAVLFATQQLSKPSERTLESLADEAGLSHRRFIQLFRREVGLTPRDFRRVHRFHHAMTFTGLDGFFDQSHWALECRKLSGWTPTALGLASRGADVLPAELRGQMLPILGR
ncbi:MAG: DUF6597 domain-containing transcriptional factor [Archangium sp.]